MITYHALKTVWKNLNSTLINPEMTFVEYCIRLLQNQVSRMPMYRSWQVVGNRALLEAEIPVIALTIFTRGVCHLYGYSRKRFASAVHTYKYQKAFGRRRGLRDNLWRWNNTGDKNQPVCFLE